MSIGIRKLLLTVVDIIIVSLSLYLALLARFDTAIPQKYVDIYKNYALLIALIQTAAFFIFGLYKNLWVYASIEESMQIFTITAIATGFGLLLGLATGRTFPFSVYLISWVFMCMMMGGSRMSYKFLRRLACIIRNKKNEIKRVMIVGAGSAGSMIIKEMKNHAELNCVPVVVIDDDERKQGKRINRVPVSAGRSKIKELAEKYKIDEIIVAIPSAKKKEIAEILKLCKETKCKLRTLPGMYELINGLASVKQLREVNIDDLLGREEIKLNMEEIAGYLKNETVLVTGGGGSIGSELCRQIAKFGPRKLVIFDIYENTAYDLQNEFLRQYKGKLNLEVLIGSCRDRVRLKEVFEKYRPGVVFHAAAHKHVPLMEANPAEAIKNNVLGTLNTARRADDYGAKKFILISTDKAVNPTNIMGASKRLAEMIVQSMNRISNTEFA